MDLAALRLGTPGVLTVGTLSDAPPSICINAEGQFTGFDNELLRAVADKLGLKVDFVGTDFSGLLAQVAARRFDVGSSSITTTDARRKTVGFTNGYDFGYFSLVVPTGSPINGFDELAAGQRIGVVQGTVQDDYVVNTLGLDPVKFPDYNTVYANLKTGQIDAWVAPSQQASGHGAAGRPDADRREHLQPGQLRRLGRRQGEQAADRRAQLRARRRDRRRHLGEAVLRLGAPRAAAGLEARLQGGAGAAAARLRRDRRQHAPLPTTPACAPKSTLPQLKDTFLDWDLYKQAIPDLFKTGLPNTLILAVSAGIIGLVLGMLLAVAGISRTRWLRWPARVYTDVFRGLPAVVIILIIGLGVGPVVGPTDRQQPLPARHRRAGLDGGAYIGEIFRSGIQSVEAGQLEASRALGFSYSSSMRLVVVPQGVRRVLPALVNQFISLLKDSSLVYFLGLIASQRELFQVGRDLNAQTGNLSPLVAAGLFYLLLTIPLTHLVNYIDDRLRRGRPAEPTIRRARPTPPRPRRWSDAPRRPRPRPPRSSRSRWRARTCTWPSAPTRCCAASTSTCPPAPPPR